MLWLCLHLPHLTVEVRQSPETMPALVNGGEGLRRDARRALNAVASWAHQFSSDVSVDFTRRMLWLEVGSSLQYFNGLSALHAKIKDGVSALGYTATIGIAPTLEAAALLTQHDEVMPILTREQIRVTIASLPITHLNVRPKVIDQLQTAGLQTIGDVLNIPANALARRFSQDVPDYLQRLMGDRPDVRRRHRAPSVYQRKIDFMDGIVTVEGLLFPLRRILQEFEGYLRGRDVAVQHLTVTLFHRAKSGTASNEIVLRLVTSSPQRSAVQLFALIREKLERIQLSDSVTQIRLVAAEFVQPQIIQADFFDDHQRHNETWAALLDKLRARLGADSVRRLGLSDDHRPENAWCIVADEKANPIAFDYPDRPLWFLEKPKPVDLPPRLLGTPERIEAGWWTGEDAQRDYYLALTREGSRLWLFREAGTNRWYLQGLWA